MLVFQVNVDIVTDREIAVLEVFIWAEIEIMALGGSNYVCFLLKSTVFDYAVVYARWEEANLGLKKIEVLHRISSLLGFDVC